MDEYYAIARSEGGSFCSAYMFSLEAATKACRKWLLESFCGGKVYTRGSIRLPDGRYLSVVPPVDVEGERMAAVAAGRAAAAMTTETFS